MQLARVIGTAEATVKEPSLTGHKLLVTNIVDGAGKVIEPAVVAADCCGAGVGELVLLARGSAARIPAKAAGAPVDATVIAVVDRVTLAK